ncbi:ABC transporter permease [Streptomyces sp. SKN60]|uniref:ABC transporter permease n=1 Tax=Streptomyces sp. SKN60 TaxID=2855506 RepID=UPI002246CC5F|nr:ABC transporter permease [Streptomyces sp. SKN60]MCX2185761.1 ABC transporter permease [Streptomyces sp. SKN60]
MIAIAAFFSLWPETADTFLTVPNLRVLAANQAVLGIIALGALVPLICGDFDLSVGAIAGLSAVFVADALSNDTPLAYGIILGIALGASAGLINALLVTRGGVNGIITTLGTATVMSGIVSQKTGGTAVVSNIPAALTDFGSGTLLGVPGPDWVLAAVTAALYFALTQTGTGRSIYALGSNSTAARLIGLRTNVLLGFAFVLSGALSAIGGLVQIARAGGADPRVGGSFTLPALAAAFLSVAAVKPGQYNVGGTLVAIFFLAVLNNGLNLAGAPPYVASYVNGAALILGVGLAAYLGRRRAGYA